MSNKPEFYDARDAVENRLLHKCSLSTLRKYATALREHYPWKSDPLCTDAVTKTNAELRAVEEEYNRRMVTIRNRVIAFAGAVLASVIATIIVGIIL